MALPLKEIQRSRLERLEDRKLLQTHRDDLTVRLILKYCHYHLEMLKMQLVSADANPARFAALQGAARMLLELVQYIEEPVTDIRTDIKE